MKYRPEIDGLRALAVIPVLFFHAGFELFKGGYVGVDIFFVISGYLITSIIINQLQSGKFSLINFYERRARRILPPLYFVMLLCIPFAWIFLFPSDIKDFSQSLIAISTFSSNFLFWQESGYFETAAELKPLLHTWSLSVEEQYYILFPVFLIVAWKFGEKWIINFLILIFIMSLCTAHWASYNAPSANFYLLPTRGWELLLGVFTAFFIKNNDFFKSKIINQFASIVGSIFIFFSIFTYDDKTPFPGLFALLPTVGTALLIMTGIKDTLVYKILSNKILVGIGLISYSTYLWHVPLFVFAKHISHEEPSTTLISTLIFLSFFLAYISWKYVEKPFRDPKLINRKNLILWLSSFFLFFMLIGIGGHYSNGYEKLKINKQFSEKEKNNYQLIKKAIDYDLYTNMFNNGECQFWVIDIDEIKIEKFESCKNKYKKGVLVLGDSHSMNLYNILAKSDSHPFLIGISQGGFRAHAEDGLVADEKRMNRFNSIIEFVDFHDGSISNVIYHQSGSYFIKGKLGEYEPSFIKNKLNEITYVPNNVIDVINYLDLFIKRGIQATWIGPFTEYRRDPKKEVKRLSKIDPITNGIFKNLDNEIIATLQEFNFKDYISFNTLYKIPMSPIIEDCFIWRDQDHFSRCGEEIIAKDKLFTSKIKKILQSD